MTVANPDFLLIFNNTSGTTVTNYGSVGTAYTIAQGTENTDWVWHPNSGPFTGYLDSLSDGFSGMTYLNTAATAPSAVLESMNCAIAFKIRTLGRGGGTRLVSPTAGPNGNMKINLDPAAGAGDFDMTVQFIAQGGTTVTQVYSALTFNTQYQLACSFDPTIIAACIGKFKLNSASVQTPATSNCVGITWDAAWPFVLRRADFTDYFGMDGEIYYFAFGRGDTVWSSTDLDDINASPSTAITGWPSSGVNRTPTVGSLSISGVAPVVTQQINRIPLVGALAFTGVAPGITAAGNSSITPLVGSLTLSGVTSVVTNQGTISPGTGALAFTGYVSPQTLSVPPPTAAAMVFTGLAPVITVSGSRTLTPDTGVLTLTGTQSVLNGDILIRPLVGSLTITGVQPQVGANAVIIPNAGSLTAAGVAASLTTQIRITPDTGQASIVGGAAALSQNILLRPSVGALAFTGTRATVATPSPVIVPITGSLVLDGVRPAVNSGAYGVAGQVQGTGVQGLGVQGQRV